MCQRRQDNCYLDGKPAGSCYAYVTNGYVVMDALVVRESFRKRYVATTLMKHIASRFTEEMFLHADADDTPKEMYGKMGFETIDQMYEYVKVWDMVSHREELGDEFEMVLELY